MDALKLIFTYKKWIFPVVLMLIVIFLAAMQIHGSSIGLYGKVYQGKDFKDPNLITGQPQMARSDEWMVNTGYTISQRENNYSESNRFVGNGLNVTVDTDAPYKGWSMIFKPQNLSFFMMPFSNAFAFKWWIIGYTLIVSCYFFILYFLPNKIWLAVFLSLSLFFSPFIQWWYQSITLLPLAYSFLILLALFKFTRSRKVKDLIAYGAIIAYLLVCFVLILYPPFLIPCAIVIGITYLSFLLQNRKSIFNGPWKKQILVLVLAGIVAAGVVALFIYTRAEAVTALRNSVYPGSRITNSGGYRPRLVFDGLFNTFLQNSKAAKTYYTNQSEASRFILIFPFLILPLVYILYKRYKTKKQTDFFIVGLFFLMLVFLARIMSTLPNQFFKLFLLHRAPSGRLIIAFGMLNILAITYLVKYFETKKRLPKSIIVLSTILTAIVSYFIYRALHNYYPDFLKPYSTGIWLIIVFTFAVWLLLIRKATLAAGIILVMIFLSTYQVNPLYKGTGVVFNESINKALHQVDPDKKGNWALVQGGMLNMYLAMNGYRAASGVYLYPDLKFWRKYDTNLDEEVVYNRYAHALFVPNDEVEPSKNFELTTQDFFWVLLNGCNNNIQANLQYIMSHVPLNDACLTLKTESNTQNSHFYFYKVKNAN